MAKKPVPRPYFPHAYVPGGAPPPAARAIQAKGYAMAARPTGGGGGARPAVDPWTGLLKDVRSQIAALGHPNIKKDPTLLAWQAERKSLADEISAEQLRIQKEGDRAGNYALALTRLNAQDEGDVAQQYRNAAAQVQGLGTGLTGTVQEAQQQSADQTAAAVNAVTAGRAPVGGIAGYDPAALRNVSQLTGVTMPATSFAEESARAASEAAMRTKEAGWNILGISQDYRQQAIDARIKSGLEVKKLLAQRPELVAKIQATYRTDRQNAVKILATIVNQRETAKREATSAKAYSDWLKTQGVAKVADVTGVGKTGKPTPASVAETHRHDEAIAAQKADTAAKKADQVAARGRLAEQYTGTNHFASDWQGKPILDAQGNKQPVGGYKLDKKGNVVKGYAPAAAAAAAAAKPPNYSDITALQSSMSDGITAKFKLDKTFLTKAELAAPVWSRKRISSWLMRQYGNAFLSRYPAQKKAVQSWADNLAASTYADLLKRKRAGR